MGALFDSWFSLGLDPHPKQRVPRPALDWSLGESSGEKKGALLHLNGFTELTRF